MPIAADYSVRHPHRGSSRHQGLASDPAAWGAGWAVSDRLISSARWLAAAACNGSAANVSNTTSPSSHCAKGRTPTSVPSRRGKSFSRSSMARAASLASRCAIRRSSGLVDDDVALAVARRRSPRSVDDLSSPAMRSGQLALATGVAQLRSIRPRPWIESRRRSPRSRRTVRISSGRRYG